MRKWASRLENEAEIAQRFLESLYQKAIDARQLSEHVADTVVDAINAIYKAKRAAKQLLEDIRRLA